MWRLPISMNSSFSVANIPPQEINPAPFPPVLRVIHPWFDIGCFNISGSIGPTWCEYSTYSTKNGSCFSHWASKSSPRNRLHEETESCRNSKPRWSKPPGVQCLGSAEVWGNQKTNAEVVSSWEIKQLYANPQVTWYILISLIEKLTRIQQKKWCGSKRPMINGAPC